MPPLWTERLRACPDLQSTLNCAMDEALTLGNTALGNIQLMDWDTGDLKIVVQRGFKKDFLDFFATIKPSEGSACARALRNGQTVVIEDVTVDTDFVSCRDIALRSGFRAVQSTPLISSSGSLLGVLSTHFPVPHRPTKSDINLFRQLARITADTIIRCRVRANTPHDLHGDMPGNAHPIPPPPSASLRAHIDYCLRRAMEADELTKKAFSEELRKAFLGLAQSWRELASSAEDTLRDGHISGKQPTH